MDIIKAFAVNNPCYKAGVPMKPVGILVHSTGANNPYLKRYVDAPAEVGVNKYNNTWNTTNTTVLVHAFIGYDKNNDVRVAQCLPYNVACWGCGSGKNGSYNRNPVGHIQFEICEDGLDNELYFKECWRVAVEYCAELCKKYGFDPLKNITSHYEAHAKGYASNHGDPAHWFKRYGLTMNDFRKAVYDYMNAKNEEKNEETKLYRVQVGAFAIRANAENMKKKLKEAGFDGFIVG